MSALADDRSRRAIKGPLAHAQWTRWDYVVAIQHGRRTLAKLYKIKNRLIELEKRVATLADPFSQEVV